MNLQTFQSKLSNMKSTSSCQFVILSKENSDLKSNYLEYEKQITRINNKLTKMEKVYNESKKLNSNLTKELTIIKLSNEKLLKDLFAQNKQLEANKLYMLKLESKIVEITQPKNQSIVELNVELKKDNKDLNTLIREITNKNNEYINQIKEYKTEIDILSQALNVKTDNLKYKNDIKSSLFYEVGKMKQELDDTKIQIFSFENKLTHLREENEKMKQLLQEISFEKTNLVEEIVEIKMNKALKMQNKDKYIKELQIEKDKLAIQIRKLKTILNSQKKNRRFLIQITNSKSNSKNSNHRKEILNLNSDILTEFDSQKINKKLKNKTSIIIESNELKLATFNLNKNNESLLNQKEVINNANKTLIRTNELLQDSNNVLSNQLNNMKKELDNKKEIKEQVEDLTRQVFFKNNEIETQKNKINEYITQCELLISENNSLKELIQDVKFQNEKLIHQKIRNTIQTKESIIDTNNITPIHGDFIIKESNMLFLIKKEKAKNNEYNNLNNQFKKQITE